MPLFLLLIILGIKAIASDFKDKKIRNKDLLLALFAGILIYAGLLATGKIIIYWPLFLGNMALALVLAVVLYKTGSWGGGDAKFFLVVSFLVPAYPHFPILPLSSAIIFLMTFFLSSLYFAVMSIFQIPMHPILCKKSFQIDRLAKNLALSFFVVLCLSWILTFLLRHPVLQTAPVIKIILLYLGYTLIWKFSDRFRKTVFFWVFGCAALAVRLLIEPAQLNPEQISDTLLKITIYSTLFYILNSLIFFYRECSVSRQRFIFAHFIFSAAVLAYTPFFCWILKGFQCLQRLSLR